MNNYQFMAKIWQEDDWFIAQDIFSGVTTQGKNLQEARENLKEAVELYLEEPPAQDEIASHHLLNTILMPLEVKYGQKITV